MVKRLFLRLPRRFRYYGIPFVLAVGALILGEEWERFFVWVGLSDHWAHSGSSFMHELPMAVLIAVVLALTFEKISQREFNEMATHQRDEYVKLADQQRTEFIQLAEQQRKDGQADVFKAIFGVHLPQNLRDEIIDQVFWFQLTRQHMEVEYHIDPCPGHPDYALVQVYASYEFHNATSKPVPLPLTIKIDRPPLPDMEPLVDIGEVAVTGADQPLALHRGEITLHDETEHKVFRLSDTGRSLHVVPGTPATVKFCFRAVEDLKYGHREIDFAHHVLGMKMRVEVAPALARLLHVSASVTAGRLIEDERDEEHGHYAWTLERPLLPGQGMDLKWRRNVIDISTAVIPPADEAPAAAPPSGAAQDGAPAVPAVPAEAPAPGAEARDAAE